MIKTKWFIYTVIVGLIPFIVRLCIFIVSIKKDTYLLFDPMDFAILGLVVNITNINELEGRKDLDSEWKSKCIGISVICIVVYAVLFAITIIYSINSNIFDKKYILVSSVILSITSVFYSFSIFDRLNKLKGV